MADIEKITANGTTYDIADAQAREDIEELNTKLDESVGVKTGYVAVSATANSYGDADVTFDTAIPSNKNYRCFCCISSTSSASNYGMLTAMIYSQSRTGLTIRVANASSTTYSPVVYWFAIEY